MCACKTSGQNKVTENCNTEIKQGIRGYVQFKSGNFMPSPDAPSSNSSGGVEREVHIYELTNIKQVEAEEQFYSNIKTKLIKIVRSDSTGCFQASLAPGAYSIFVKEKGKLYANLFDGKNNIFPVTVEPGEKTEIDFDISYDATY